MTKEEAIELFKDVEVLVFRDVKQKYFHEDIEEAFKLAIKALEQESILDKIRAEIEQITDTMGVSYNQYVSKIDVLQIIDKYLESKAESEDKE